jgi:hypothetical protein
MTDTQIFVLYIEPILIVIFALVMILAFEWFDRRQK